MTDKEYREQKARVRKFFDKWHGPLGMCWFSVEYEWDRERNPDESREIMKTEVSWEYREVTITVRMPACINLSDKKLEHIVVHEFSHALTGGFMSNMDLDNQYACQIMENATESIANALLWTREEKASK